MADITRSQPGTRHTDSLVQQLAALHGPCIGCRDCTGLCQVLIDALVLPDTIVNCAGS